MLIAPKMEPIILDSNVPLLEDGITVWNDTDIYALNDTVQVDGGKRIYKALQDVPENINPLDDVIGEAKYGEYWFDMGATNHYRAFDEKTSSVTSNADEIYYKFSISLTDMLMLENLIASEVQIRVTNTSNGEIIQNKTISTVFRDISDAWEWTYMPPEYVKTTGAMLNMVYAATLEIWIRNTAGVSSVGHIVYGRSQNVGLSLMDPSPTVSYRGIMTKSRDKNGDILSRKGVRYKRMTISCLIKNSSLDQIKNRLEKFADIPLIIVGDSREDGFKSLVIFGEIKDHDTPIGISYTQYQLEVEGYI